MNIRAGIEREEACAQPLNNFTRCGIGFGQHDAVRHRRLLHRFNVVGQLLFAVHRINRRDNAGERIARCHERHFNQRMHDRRGIGETGRFDDDAFEIRHLSVGALEIKIAQCLHHIARHRAANAAVRHDHDVVRGFAYQQMVDRHGTKFVDQYRRFLHRRMFQQAIEQGGFAAAEKARQ